jgi:hypothetical protein
MQTVAKLSNQEKSTNKIVPYHYKRRVYEIRSPCQWLKHCYDGKCPALMRIDGNFYCGKEGIT